MADGLLLAGSQGTFPQRLTNQTRGVKQSQYMVKGQKSRFGMASCLFESAVREHRGVETDTLLYMFITNILIKQRYVTASEDREYLRACQHL